MNEIHTGFVNNRILKLQVGFLLSEGAGQSRDIEFDVPQALRLSEDLMLDSLRGTLHLSRSSRGILVQGALETSRQGECGRCLSDATIQITVPVEELFVYPPEPGAESAVAEDGILDIAPLLREEIFLLMPIGVLCQPDCAGLCPICGRNLNDGPCEHQHEAVDPRFAALSALKDDLLGE